MTNSTTQTDSSMVPGQSVLPGMGVDLGYESIVLKPDMERVCWEYVLRGNNGTRAYKAVHPEVTDATAAVKFSQMVRKDNVIRRIVQIRDELKRRYTVTADDLMQYHGKVLNVSRDEYLDIKGEPKKLEDIDPVAKSILEFDCERDPKYGTIKVVFKVPQRHQSAVELAKIMGLHKDKLELTGKDGGALEHVVGVAATAEKLNSLREKLKAFKNNADSSS